MFLHKEYYGSIKYIIIQTNECLSKKKYIHATPDKTNICTHFIFLLSGVYPAEERLVDLLTNKTLRSVYFLVLDRRLSINSCEFK